MEQCSNVLWCKMQFLLILHHPSWPHIVEDTNRLTLSHILFLGNEIVENSIVGLWWRKRSVWGYQINRCLIVQVYYLNQFSVLLLLIKWFFLIWRESFNFTIFPFNKKTIQSVAFVRGKSKTVTLLWKYRGRNTFIAIVVISVFFCVCRLNMRLFFCVCM